MPQDVFEPVVQPTKQSEGFKAYFSAIIDDYCGTPSGPHTIHKKDILVALAIQELAQQLSSAEMSKAISKLALAAAEQAIDSVAWPDE